MYEWVRIQLHEDPYFHGIVSRYNLRQKIRSSFTQNMKFMFMGLLDCMTFRHTRFLLAPSTPDLPTHLEIYLHEHFAYFLKSWIKV